MIDKIIAMLRHSNKCNHKHTFDILFTVTDKANGNHDFLLTICDDCKKLISYTDVEAEIKELKNDMMDELRSIHSDDVTAVIKTDKNGQFVICDAKSGEVIQTINFQHGSDKVNGVTNEDLLSAVLLRMQAFQKTNLRCKETDEAMIYIKGALKSIEKRNRDREIRQVKGTMKP